MKEPVIESISRYRLAWGALGLCLGLTGLFLAVPGAAPAVSIAVALAALSAGVAVGNVVAAAIRTPGMLVADSHRVALRCAAPLWGVGLLALAASVACLPGLVLHGSICCFAAALAMFLRRASSTTSGRSNDRLAAVVIAVSVIVGFVLFYQGVFIHDAHQYRAQLHSIAADRDLDFYDDVALNDVFRTHNPFPRGSARYIGTCLAEFPFWLAGRAVQWIQRRFQADVVRNIPGDIALMVEGTAAVVYGLVGMVLCFAFLRVWFSRGASLAAVLLCAWASPLPFYIFLWSGWPHPVSFCLVSAFLVAWARTRHSRTMAQWAALGMLAGMIALVRPVDALACVVVIPDIARHGTGGGQKALAALSVFTCAAAVAFLPQIVLWKMVSGRWFCGPYGEVGDAFRWLDSDLMGLLFSPSRHGLIAWHPVFGLGFVGLCLFAYRDRRTGLTALAILLGAVHTLSTWSVWWTGVGFGNRFFVGFLPLFALGLAELAEFSFGRVGVPLTAFAGGVLVAGNVLLMCAYLAQAIPQGIPEPTLVTDYSLSAADLARFFWGANPRLVDALVEGILDQGPPVFGRLLEAMRWGDVSDASSILLLTAAVAVAVLLLARWIGGTCVETERRQGAGERIFVAAGAVLAACAAWWMAFVCEGPKRGGRFHRMEFEPAFVDRQSGVFSAPALCPFPVTAVDVINALEYAHGAGQGEPMAVITVTDAAGVSRSKTLRAGIDTAETSFLRPDQASAVRHRIDGLEIARARSCRSFSARKYPLLVFRSRFELPAPMVVRVVHIEHVSTVGRTKIEDVFLRDFPCH